MVFYWGLYHLACILVPCRNMGGGEGGGGTHTALWYTATCTMEAVACGLG